MKKILQKEAPVLREISQNIPLNSIHSPKIKKIIKEMKVALASQDDGVALAAIQIGYPLRMFVVSKKVFEISKIAKKGSSETAKEGIAKNGSIDTAKEGLTETTKKNLDETNSITDAIFINPVLKKISIYMEKLAEEIKQ
ncbi:MAG: peptide deformylase [Candidatus Zambryskibacteria bacterium]|nr:peptide deformylase [Candidatus Zambryskibacteria bacterium]